MTSDDELLDKMHAAYHLAWEKADRRRNVTRQVMAPLLALVREHVRAEAFREAALLIQRREGDCPVCHEVRQELDRRIEALSAAKT